MNRQLFFPGFNSGLPWAQQTKFGMSWISRISFSMHKINYEEIYHLFFTECDLKHATYFKLSLLHLTIFKYATENVKNSQEDWLHHLWEKLCEVAFVFKLTSIKWGFYTEWRSFDIFLYWGSYPKTNKILKS